ncbi:trypsin-like peptidase domain-containing protein [Streptomyces sp. NPDC093085]|uniref:trypsin-like peptidase domain-containing protein n=1 Tax=Streptomyces sp. NPDC093085 TaxID=3155068 RepID=UPI003445CE61
MSTENEGTTGPAVPSVPPVPDAAPEGTPASASRETAGEATPGSAGSEPRQAPATPSAPQDRTPGPYPADRPADAVSSGQHSSGQHSADRLADAVPSGQHPAGPPPHTPQHPPYAPPAPPVPPAAPSAPASGYAAPEYPAPGYSAAAHPQGPVPVGASVGEPTAARAADADWPPPPPVQPAYGAGGDAPVWGAPMPGNEPKPPRRGGGGLIAAVLVAALVAGGVGGGVGYWAAENNDGGLGSTTVSAEDAPKEVKRDAGTVASVAAKSLPSVVTIEAKGGNGEGGTGTGFIYDKEGHILTNNHVVASAADGGELTATFSNGKKYAAEVVGRAQGYDVAVVKLKNAPSGLAPLPLANSEEVAVGDTTIAIGAPFGLSNTVTTGIISAKNRPVASGDGSGSGNSYMSALQTDASINPGNSGGPLLDARGAVIGINSAIQSAGSGGLGQSQAGSIGLGFAIPINQAKNVAEQLIKTGKPVYPVIGATVSMSESSEGATIATDTDGGTPSVTPNGPAATAGLKAGDVITKFNGTPIDSGPTLIGQIWTHKPGDKVTITYLRDGKESTTQVTLGKREGES